MVSVTRRSSSFRHVANDGDGTAGKGSELGGGLLEVFEFAPGDHDVGSGLGQPVGDGFADATAAPGDEGGFAGKRVGDRAVFEDMEPTNYRSRAAGVAIANGQWACVP